jgi:hypothetical protein
MAHDDKKVIPATEFSHHDNSNIWSVSFPLSDPEVLRDFQWEVYLKAGGARLEDWLAQSMAQHGKADGTTILELRFLDRGKPPFDPRNASELAARLVSPRS